MNKSSLARFGILGAFFIWLIYSFPSFHPIPELTAKTVDFFLSLFKINAVNYGRFLIVEFKDINRIFDISAECAGIIIFSVFLFATFIVPGYKLKHRLVTLGFIPILFLGNSFRILLSVVLARNYSVEFSIFFHNTFGQVFIFGITILCYIFALKICNNFPTENLLKNKSFRLY